MDVQLLRKERLAFYCAFFSMQRSIFGKTHDISHLEKQNTLHLSTVQQNATRFFLIRCTTNDRAWRGFSDSVRWAYCSGGDFQSVKITLWRFSMPVENRFLLLVVATCVRTVWSSSSVEISLARMSEQCTDTLLLHLLLPNTSISKTSLRKYLFVNELLCNVYL